MIDNLSNEQLTRGQRVRRVLGWATVMAFLWGWFPCLLAGGWFGVWWWGSIFAAEPLPTGDDDGGGWIVAIAFFFLATVALFWILGGAVAGAVAGFYAPASQPKAPWRSGFFRRVGRRTFWRWNGLSLLSFVASFTIIMAIPFQESVPGLESMILFAIIASYGLSLWSSLRSEAT